MFKILIFEIKVLCVFACYASAQIDFVIYTENADFSFYKTSNVKYYGTNKVEKLKEVAEVENVSRVVLLKEGSLKITDASFNTFDIKLKDINEVTLKTGNVSPFAVIVPAVIVGGLAGSVIGGALCDPGPTHSFEEASGKFFMKLAGYVLGTLIGAVAGGIGGVVIINAINYETLDLFSVSEKNKKNKLIKFLRQKKN